MECITKNTQKATHDSFCNDGSHITNNSSTKSLSQCTRLQAISVALDITQESYSTGKARLKNGRARKPEIRLKRENMLKETNPKL